MESSPMTERTLRTVTGVRVHLVEPPRLAAICSHCMERYWDDLVRLKTLFERREQRARAHRRGSA
jgi:hypothetical protein